MATGRDGCTAPVCSWGVAGQFGVNGIVMMVAVGAVVAGIIVAV